MAAPRLLYATPTGNHPTVGYVISQRAVEMACRSFGVRHPRDFQFAKGPVHMARSEIARQTVKGRCHVEHPAGTTCKTSKGTCQVDPYDFVLMHDDDVTIYPQADRNPIDEFKAIFDADPKVGVVGALYLRANPLLVNLTVPHPRHPTELCHVIHGIPGQPFEAGGIATGFMMIRRELLEQLGDIIDDQGGGSMFRFPSLRTEWGTIYDAGEDYDFCVRARALGWKVIADPRWITTHIKERGPLVYEHAAWERKWETATPASACIQELREACPDTFRVEKLPNGMIFLDHTDQRKLDARKWRDRLAAKASAPAVDASVASEPPAVRAAYSVTAVDVGSGAPDVNPLAETISRYPVPAPPAPKGKFTVSEVTL